MICKKFSKEESKYHTYIFIFDSFSDFCLELLSFIANDDLDFTLDDADFCLEKYLLQ